MMSCRIVSLLSSIKRIEWLPIKFISSRCCTQSITNTTKFGRRRLFCSETERQRILREYERRHNERRPKALFLAMTFGVSAATLSTIAYFEFIRQSHCENIETEGVSGGQRMSEDIAYKEEKRTKTRFPVTLFSYESSSSVHWLLGVSVRCMMGLCSWERARAYSYGLYVSQQGIERLKDEVEIGLDISQENLKSFMLPLEPVRFECEEISAKSLTSDINSTAVPFISSLKYEGRKPGYFFTTSSKGTGYYLDNDTATTVHEAKASIEYPSAVLRLVMLRDVKCSHVANGFDNTLKRTIKQLNESDVLVKQKIDEVIKEFVIFISSQKDWKKGTCVDLLRLPQGRLEVFVDGNKSLLLESEILSWALFEAYYGKNGHMSSECKTDILDRTKEILNVL